MVCAVSSNVTKRRQELFQDLEVVDEEEEKHRGKHYFRYAYAWAHGRMQLTLYCSYEPELWKCNT